MQSMAGTLYLVATPIGNLEDITLRALRVLREADLIACEDTRTSRVLLKAYEIDAALTSYHKFNEQEKSEELIEKLLRGKSIALITDAGMPAISDPGEILVRKCRENGIPVTAVPGASACVTALALSGADTRRFVFEGFLPQESKERRETLSRIQAEERTVILYEAPHRLERTLRLLEESLGSTRGITLCRELTKKFEETERTTIGNALLKYQGDVQPRGEYVLVIDGKSKEEAAEERSAAWESMDLSGHVSYYEERGLSRKEAMKAVSKDRGISRRDVYQELLKEKQT